ncbi:sterol desaturase family protein [Aspergillus affinis]|uniref:sterol desaturase family protein n=1 Tax=Aspergillus affinis TaxID=1070780 RepID=UPI0022FE89C2|nr:uncharacterized protein KD926_003130 [Aspergillus affinis]KAI9035686.1 hypothetical protein KD926_003130 [Aspergillus affinis]
MGRAAESNPHSMISDWPFKDRSTWNGPQRFVDFMNLYPVFPRQPLPSHSKTDKIPYMSQWSLHRFIIVFAAIPMLFHQTWIILTGCCLGKCAAFFLYSSAYALHIVHHVRLLRRGMYQYGCFDGDIADRDGVPNSAVGKILGSLCKVAGFRVALAVLITYNPDVSPLTAISDFTSWAPFLAKLSLYGLVLDFWFYIYHRACHEVPFLWKYHRTHHLTKHPTAAFSAFADDEQELFETVIVPLLALGTMGLVGLPLGFYEWWFCLEYVIIAEIAGHSGIRLHSLTPSPVLWLLRLYDVELAIEDHDLHHRKGYRKSFNYGKQTRVWDRLFGTCGERVEARQTNIDYERVVWMDLF